MEILLPKYFLPLSLLMLSFGDFLASGGVCNQQKIMYIYLNSCKYKRSNPSSPQKLVVVPLMDSELEESEVLEIISNDILDSRMKPMSLKSQDPLVEFNPKFWKYLLLTQNPKKVRRNNAAHAVVSKCCIEDCSEKDFFHLC